MKRAKAARPPAPAAKPSARAAQPIRIDVPKRQSLPIVLASPHSGTDYQPRLLAQSKLDLAMLRRSEDSFVDELFGTGPGFGAPLLRALFPRVFLDVNREPYELDQTMFAEPLPAFAKTRSERVRSGFGTIARLVTTGAEIYQAPLSFAEAEERLRSVYQPYHQALQGLLDRTTEQFGFAILIDCHSMPSVGGPGDRDRGRARTDIVLGDRYGTSCAGTLTDAAERALQEQGFRVARNDPYAGAQTLIQYGKPESGVHALQIELNRALYMDERRFERLSGFAEVAARLGRFISALGTLDHQILRPKRAA